MKKSLLGILVVAFVLSVSQAAYATSFQLEQGYQYFFKYTNFEYIPEGTGFTTGSGGDIVPNEIKGFYTVTTIERAPAELLGKDEIGNLALLFFVFKQAMDVDQKQG